MEWGNAGAKFPPMMPIVLEYEWVLWYDEGSPKGQSHADYENSMKLLGSFSTVQVCSWFLQEESVVGC